MADNFDNYGMKVQARVDLPSNKDIDAQIRKLEKSISKLKVSGQFDDTALKNLTNQLNTLKATVTTANFSPTALTELTNQVNKALQNINIGNINVGNTTSQAQQVGQQIGNAISQGINQSTSNVSQATGQILRDFSELNEAKRKFVDGENGKGQFFSEKEIADANKFYQTIRDAFKEFGQVTISKGEMTDGNLENLRVKIQQVNGELKTTREFMLYLNESTKGSGSFRLVDDDTIKTTESMVQHLNEAKNITNATGDEANALKQKLAEQEKYYDKLEQASKEQLAIEKQRITAGEKQLEVLDKQSKRRDSRKSYNEGQINKKGLTDTERQKEINDLVYAGNEKYDSAFAKEIDKSLSNLSDLKSKWKEQGIYVDEFKTKVESLETSLNGIDSGDVKGLNAIKQKMEELKTEANQLVDVNKIQLLSNGGIKNDYATQIAKLEGDFRSLGLAQDTITTKTQNVKNSLATLRAEFAKPVDQQNFQAIQTANDNLQRELVESRNEFEQLRASMKGMATEQQRLSLANTIEAWNQKNTAATKAVREENERYVLSLRDLSNQMTRIDFNKINTGFKQNENSMRAMNRLGKSLKEQFKQAYESFTMWLSASSLVMKVVSETKQAITELKDVNTLLNEISKANDKLTKEQLAKIADDGFDTASKYGKKVTDYLSGVQEASRAGYKNAEAIAELSVAIQGAGDVTEDVANSYVIATDKAYKLGGSVEALTEVFDGTNKITNLNAVNMSELAEAMTIVGSTAASFGVEVDETTAAIATMSAVTQQSGSEVARAFRAILLNIRQVSDEEEGIDTEGLTKYEKACNALGVSLKETKNGVLETRDAMDVLKELSEEYVKLDENDLRRTELLNSVGGKVYHVI